MADPGIFDWGRGPSFGLERTVELFVANYFSRRQPRVSQSVNAGRRWRGKYCFASEANRSQEAPKNNNIF